MQSDAIHVLFVCLGNICRSPLAEAIVRRRARERGISHHFRFASAGTGDLHIGGGADMRAMAAAARHGLDLSSHYARQIKAVDIGRWHWFVAMDAENRRDLLEMGVPGERILMMRQFEIPGDDIPDVPDPYFEEAHGFEQVFEVLERNADSLLDYLLAHL
jgi:Protein-tyrosine-phosphatase